MESFGSKIGLVCGLIALLIVLSATRCSKQPEQKNRVPTLPEQIEQAQQAAADARTAADAATKALKDTQDAIEGLHGTQLDSSGNLKEERPQQTGPGIISDFGTFRIEAADGESASEDSYLGFTFTDVNGFTKRFFPVCPNQTLKSSYNGHISILYHWRHYQALSVGQRGCYSIDGFQQ